VGPGISMLNGTITAKPKLSGSILVVEDDPDIRSLTVSILERAGASVAGASSAAEAIACLEQRRFDAVVLDWNLAGDTGGALLAQLRDRNPDLLRRSAVVTGDVMSIPGQHEAETYGCPVLAKPFRPQQLLSTVAAMLSHTVS